MRLNKRCSSKVYLILSKILYLIFLVVIVCMLGNLFSPLTVKAHHCSKCQMEEKKIFLTFDDGPSPNNTLKILNILKENNIKATFFVVGNMAETYPSIVKALNDNGMCILPHTYCHEYKTIYSSTNSYFNDLNKCINSITKITGKVPPKYTRLPGGSDNQVCSKNILSNIRNNLNIKGFDYIDWNVTSGDAMANTVATSTIKTNVNNQCSSKKLGVVLMHDCYYKTTTVEALPATIKNLKSQGFKFRTFNDLTLEEKENMIRLGIMNRR